MRVQAVAVVDQSKHVYMPPHIARNAHIIAAALVATLSLSVWVGLPESTELPEDEIRARAADAHLLVGDVQLVLPTFALPSFVSMGMVFTLDRAAARKTFREERAALRAASANHVYPLRLDMIELKLDALVSDDFGLGLKRVCTKLNADWAKSVCGRPLGESRFPLPRDRFYLADGRHLEAFRHQFTVGMENRHDQLKLMSLREGVASVICDAKLSGGYRHCTAAARISGNLVAVWTVSDRPEETAEERADRERRTIFEFVALTERRGG
jgi:hypothetical protein